MLSTIGVSTPWDQSRQGATLNSFKLPNLRNQPISILYVEQSFVIVDNPAYFLSVPGRGPDMDDCVVKRVRELFPHAKGPMSVHRLDVETSGLMVVALRRDTHRNLSLQFEKRKVEKKYEALLEGCINEDRGHIELAFSLDWPNRPKRRYDPENGKLGVTDWEVIKRNKRSTRVAFKPLTGRTHQLRVHSAHELGIGHPILGDSLYGNPELADRLMLHSNYLSFDHPETNKRLQFDIPTPF